MSDPQSTSPTNTTRLRFLKEVYWRLGVFIVLAIYNTLQLIFNIIAWTTSPKTQQKYQLINMVQAFSLRTWAIGLLLLLIIITFEGAYRFLRQREIIFGERIDNLEAAVHSLEEELEPKLAIVFEPNYPYLYYNSSSGVHEIRIGVKNVSGKELSRVRVQLDDMRYGSETYNSLPLHVTRTKRLYEYPYQTEFPLNPGETENLDLAMLLLENSYVSFSYSGGAPDHIKKGEPYEFTITATASEGKPLRKRAALTVNTSAPWFTLSLKD
jgi:hypothetical protein